MATIERRENPYSTRVDSDRDVSRLCIRDRATALKLSENYGGQDRPRPARKQPKPTLSTGVGTVIKNWRVNYGDF